MNVVSVDAMVLDGRWLCCWLQVNGLAVCGSELFATCSDDGSVRVWSQQEREQTLHFQVMHQSCNCLAFSAPRATRTKKQTSSHDAQNDDASSAASSLSGLNFPSLAAGYSDGTIRMFDLNKVEMALKIQPHARAVTALCFASDGKAIVPLVNSLSSVLLKITGSVLRC